MIGACCAFVTAVKIALLSFFLPFQAGFLRG